MKNKTLTHVLVAVFLCGLAVVVFGTSPAKSSSQQQKSSSSKTPPLISEVDGVQVVSIRNGDGGGIFTTLRNVSQVPIALLRAELTAQDRADGTASPHSFIAHDGQPLPPGGEFELGGFSLDGVEGSHARISAVAYIDGSIEGVGLAFREMAEGYPNYLDGMDHVIAFVRQNPITGTLTSQQIDNLLTSAGQIPQSRIGEHDAVGVFVSAIKVAKLTGDQNLLKKIAQNYIAARPLLSKGRSR